MEFFVSIFGKIHQTKSKYKIEQSGNLLIFSNHYFSYVRHYKATLASGN